MPNSMNNHEFNISKHNEWVEELAVVYEAMRKCGVDRAKKLPFPNRELFEFYIEQYRKDGTPTGLPHIMEYKNNEVKRVEDVFNCLRDVSEYSDYCFFCGRETDYDIPDEYHLFCGAEARHYEESHTRGLSHHLKQHVETFINDWPELFPKWTNSRNKEVMALILIEMFTWSQNHTEDVEWAKKYLDILKARKDINRLLLKL